MKNTLCVSTFRTISLVVTCCCTLAVLPLVGVAQAQETVVPVVSEPGHRIRFDNGLARIYEVNFPSGEKTLWHEHSADSFSVLIGASEITNEPLGGKPFVVKRASGAVTFNSTANGPYSHRVIVSGEKTFHILVMELLRPSSLEANKPIVRSNPFTIALENSRGRAYRLVLQPGQSTDVFIRSAHSALFAISAGRLSEHRDGQPARLWDFEPAHFRWFDTSDQLSLKNESATPIELIEVEVW